MRVSAKLGLTLLSAALAGGCATHYRQPDSTEPHGTLAFPSQEAQRSSGVFMEPLEFNGVQRPRYWVVQEQFRVPPGELQLLVRAARENLQGTCQLNFPVAASETYTLGARAGEEAFTIHASRDGQVIAECEGPSTLLPTPFRLPGRLSAG